jgi:hypothetical protein
MKPKPAACNYLQLTLPRIERDEARQDCGEDRSASSLLTSLMFRKQS